MRGFIDANLVFGRSDEEIAVRRPVKRANVLAVVCGDGAHTHIIGIDDVATAAIVAVAAVAFAG